MSGEDAQAVVDREFQEAARKVFESYDGRLFIEALLARCTSETGTTFCGEAPLSMAFYEGKRVMAETLRELMLTLSPQTYMMMRGEAVVRQQRYDELKKEDPEND